MSLLVCSIIFKGWQHALSNAGTTLRRDIGVCVKAPYSRLLPMKVTSIAVWCWVGHEKWGQRRRPILFVPFFCVLPAQNRKANRHQKHKQTWSLFVTSRIAWFWQGAKLQREFYMVQQGLRCVEGQPGQFVLHLVSWICHPWLPRPAWDAACSQS